MAQDNKLATGRATVENSTVVKINLTPSDTVQTNLDTRFEVHNDDTFASVNSGATYTDYCKVDVQPSGVDGEFNVTITGVQKGYVKMIVGSQDNDSVPDAELKITIGDKVTAVAFDNPTAAVTIP